MGERERASENADRKIVSKRDGPVYMLKDQHFKSYVRKTTGAGGKLRNYFGHQVQILTENEGRCFKVGHFR